MRLPQSVCRAWAWINLIDGSNMAVKMPMMEITTNSSVRVKALVGRLGRMAGTRGWGIGLGIAPDSGNIGCEKKMCTILSLPTLDWIDTHAKNQDLHDFNPSFRHFSVKLPAAGWLKNAANRIVYDRYNMFQVSQ